MKIKVNFNVEKPKEVVKKGIKLATGIGVGVIVTNVVKEAGKYANVNPVVKGSLIMTSMVVTAIVTKQTDKYIEENILND